MAKMDQQVSSTNLQFCIVSGTTAATDITCATQAGVSMAYGDNLVSVVEMAQTTNIWTDRTSTSSIQSADDKLQCSVDTSNDTLFVLWEASTATTAYSGYKIRSGIDLVVSAGDLSYDISGIEVGDIIIMAVGIDGTSGLMTDFTGYATITAAGEVDISVIDLMSPLEMQDDIFVMYYDVSAGGRGGMANQSSTAHCLVSEVVAGANANTNIAVTNIATADRVVLALQTVAADANIVADRTSTTSCTSAGNIQCMAATTSGALWVLWEDTSK